MSHASVCLKGTAKLTQLGCANFGICLRFHGDIIVQNFLTLRSQTCTMYSTWIFDPLLKTGMKCSGDSAILHKVVRDTTVQEQFCSDQLVHVLKILKYCELQYVLYLGNKIRKVPCYRTQSRDMKVQAEFFPVPLWNRVECDELIELCQYVCLGP